MWGIKVEKKEENMKKHLNEILKGTGFTDTTKPFYQCYERRRFTFNHIVHCEIDLVKLARRIYPSEKEAKAVALKIKNDLLNGHWAPGFSFKMSWANLLEEYIKRKDQRVLSALKKIKKHTIQKWIKAMDQIKKEVSGDPDFKYMDTYKF